MTMGLRFGGGLRGRRLGGRPVPAVPPIKPALLTQPSISPETGAPGAAFTITRGTYSGTPTPLIVGRLMAGEVDVTEQIVDGVYTSSTPSVTLTYSERAVNRAGFALAEDATATVTAAPGAQPAQPAATSWTLTAGEEEATIDVASLPAGAVSVQYEYPAGTWTTIAGDAVTVPDLEVDALFTTRLRGLSATDVEGPPSDPKSCTPFAVYEVPHIEVIDNRAYIVGSQFEILTSELGAYFVHSPREIPGGGGGGGGGGGDPDPGPFVPDVLAPAQTSWTVDAQISDDPGADLQVTVASAEAIQIGRSATGGLYIYNPASRSAPVTLTPSQLSVQDGTRWMHGACRGALLESAQGFDSFPITTQTDVAYSHALNIDPGATGVPITFLPGEEGTILKAISLAAPDPDGRPKLAYLYVITVLNTLPPAQHFRAAPLALTKGSTIGRADLNLNILPNYPLVAGAPDVEAMRRMYLLDAQAANFRMPRGERITAQKAEKTYRSNAAAENARAILLCASAIDPDAKADIATGLVQRGLDVAAHLRNGGSTFQRTQSGLGGVYPGYKALVAFAAVMLDDASLAALCDPAALNFVEDYQVHTVTQSHLDLYDYIEADLGMPEWNMNQFYNKGGVTRAMGKKYNGVFGGHLMGQSMAARAIPGMKSVWNFQTFFDYADRINIQTFYADPLSQVAWALTTGNKPDTFSRNFHSAYRDYFGPRWTWT
jgi:hypothetical protein